MFGGYVAPQTHVPEMGSIIAMGNSITNEMLGGSYCYTLNVFPSKIFATRIQVAYPVHAPDVYNEAIPSTTAADGLTIIDAVLAEFPQAAVNVVMLAYGTVDAANGISPSSFQTSMTSLINKVLTAGKIPVVPKIPYSTASPESANIPALNAVIAALYVSFGSSLKQGPDFFALVQAHPEYLLGDGIHLTQAGCDAFQVAWVGNLSWAYP